MLHNNESDATNVDKNCEIIDKVIRKRLTLKTQKIKNNNM